MKVIVTGGCGFIGTNVVLKLLEHDQVEAVVVIDKMTYASNDKLMELAYFHANLFIIQDDIVNIEKYNKLHDFEFCIHMAAESHVDKSLNELDNFIHTNVKGTYEVAKWCFKNDIKLIHFSTDEVYGHLEFEDGDRFQEERHPKPRNPYAVSKLFAEQMIDLANIEYHEKGKYLILRPSNNFGEYQDKTKFIPVILNSIKNNKKIPVYGEGKNEREWLYVGDTADIVTQLVTEEHNSINYFYLEDDRKYLNLGSGVDLSNVELIKNICEILDTDADNHIEFVEDPRGNMHDLKYAVDSFKLSCIYDTNKIKSNFKSNLKRTVEWFQSQK